MFKKIMFMGALVMLLVPNDVSAGRPVDPSLECSKETDACFVATMIGCVFCIWLCPKGTNAREDQQKQGPRRVGNNQKPMPKNLALKDMK